MESWLKPLYDAEGMRAVDRWAIEERGVPSLELMEAAGRAVAEAVAGLAPEGPVRVVCGKGNNGGDGFVAARLLREMGFEVEALLLWPGEELRGDAAVNFERFGGELVEGDLAGRLGGLGRGRRCDLRHRLRRGAAGAGRGGDRGDQRLRGAGRRLRHRLRGRCLQRRGGGGGGRGRRHRQLPRRQARAADRARASGTPASCGSRRSGSRPGRRARRSAARSTRRCSTLAPRRGPRSTKFSSGQVAIAGGSRGLTGAVRMTSLAAIRAGAGYATVAVPADLELVFEIAQPEVMSVACPGGDGCLVPASEKAVLRAFERAAAGVLGPGLGRDPGSFELARGARRQDRGAAGDRRRRAQRLRRAARRPGRARRRRRSSPRTPASSAGCSERDSGEVDAHRLACAPARRRGRPARSSSSRATTRSSPTATGSRSTRSRPRPSPPPAAATSSPGSPRRCWPAASSPSPPPARRSSPTPAPAARPRARVGAAESVIAGDVIDSIPAGLRPDGPVE